MKFAKRIGKLIVVSTVLLAGCDDSPSPATGSGRVMYKGSPLPVGEVNFFSAEKGLGGIAKIQEAGIFKLPNGLLPGKYAVYVTPPIPTPQPPGTPIAPPPSVNIPLRARDPATSGIIVALESGDNDVSVELKD